MDDTEGNHHRGNYAVTRRYLGQRCLTALLLMGSMAGLLSGCSPKRLVVHFLGNAITENNEVYAADDDPELIGAALPFGLKTYESLLATSPHHRRLLLATASGFTQYAYAFVQSEADRLDVTDRRRARAWRGRAQRLYLRGRDYALRGLEVAHPGFTARLHRDGAAALTMTTPDDLPFLYWAGVAWAGAIMAAKDDVQLLADLPTAVACVQRVLDLDETYNHGAAHEFFIAYEGGRPVALGGSAARARRHYQRAVELSHGQRASVHLMLAETVAVREQNLTEFRALLDTALAVDPDTVPTLRLANILAHRRARWLLSRIPDLFIDAEPAPEQSR